MRPAFEQHPKSGSHLELRVTPPSNQRHPPDRSSQRTSVKQQSLGNAIHDRSKCANRHHPKPPPSHPFSSNHNVKQQTAFNRRRQETTTRSRALVTLRASRRDADNQKSGAEPARHPPKRATPPFSDRTSRRYRPFVRAAICRRCLRHCPVPKGRFAQFSGHNLWIKPGKRRRVRAVPAREAPKPAFPAVRRPSRPWPDRVAHPWLQDSANPGTPGEPAAGPSPAGVPA